MMSSKAFEALAGRFAGRRTVTLPDGSDVAVEPTPKAFAAPESVAPAEPAKPEPTKTAKA